MTLLGVVPNSRFLYTEWDTVSLDAANSMPADEIRVKCPASHPVLLLLHIQSAVCDAPDALTMRLFFMIGVYSADVQLLQWS